MNTVNNAIVTMLFNHMMENINDRPAEEIKELKDSKVLATTYLLDEKCIVTLFPSEGDAIKSIQEHKSPEQFDFIMQEGRVVKARYVVPSDAANFITELHIATCKMVKEIQGAPYMDNPQDFYNLI